MSRESEIQERWRRTLVDGEKIPHRLFHLFGLLPAEPRCKFCRAPFKGVGGALMRSIGKRQSRNNPKFCDTCAALEPGGADIEMTMLFADVRGSTALAEKMPSPDFVALMNRFYAAATRALIDADAVVDRFIGDEVVGFFIPGIAGSDHARRGVEAARQILHATGHADPGGPWLPVGVGVHTGWAFAGVVSGVDGTARDFTALGDHVNAAARLASSAAAGEVLVSEAAAAASGLDLTPYERRALQLKGKSEPFGVHVLKIGPR